MIIEYDGGKYHGSQYQENATTVQGEVERALERLTGEKTRVALASRTDAGVHAKGQVISFKTDSAFPLKTWVSGLNYHLAGDVAVKAAYKASVSFDVRRDAWSREYRYSILNRTAPSPLLRGTTYHVAHPLDIQAMREACAVLVGEHDFAPFSTVVMDHSYRRVFRADVDKEDDLVVFDMEASSFLPHQVRNTVGGLVRVGLGKMKADTFRTLARSGRPGAIGPAAPSQGLCLMRVNYRNFPPTEEI